jgi:hypothetical protein
MVEDGSVGIRVGGADVGDGPSVGGGPAVSAITVLTSAVISIGVEIPLPGMIGAHAVRNTTRRIVKVVNFFISVSFSSRLTHGTKCSAFDCH